jgi:hypothetical protein
MLRKAPPAYLFFGVFTGFPALFPEVRSLIEARIGTIHPEGESPTFAFPETRTYARTMGTGLQRKFFVLERLWPQDALAAIKHAARDMEEVLGPGRARPVDRAVDRVMNIDPGLINDCRVILASTKDYAHRIYRGGDIWEEITLVFQNGAYRSHPWTYPDFRRDTYHTFFARFRDKLLTNAQAPPPGPA